MSVRLLDVNVLVSLLDSEHKHHKLAGGWFRTTAAAEGWATSPITENGFIRVVSQMNYPGRRLKPEHGAELLARFKSAFIPVHRFWADDITLTDTSLFDLSALTGAGQTTDAYLAGLAFKNGGRLSTFDEGIRWRAIRGADASLIERITA